MEEPFDFIIAGGGAAGLGLAYQMLHSPLRDSSILIIDQDAKRKNDRTWCFWTAHPFLYDPIVYRTWDRIGFYGDGFEGVLPLGSFRYKMIRGIDFYDLTRTSLAAAPRVQFAQAEISEIRDGADSAAVTAGGRTYRGRWVFDSIIRPGSLRRDVKRYHYLSQHFKGWEIAVGEDRFDPSVPVLFDFRTPQKGDMRFVYLLPFDARRALVEYTLFSADLLSDGEYADGIKAYLENVAGIHDYQITAEENGVIPMTDQPFPRRLGKRVMAIGVKGGRVKPSSGYAFLRMVKDAGAIVESLVRRQSPFFVPPDTWRYRFYDRIMLQLMFRRGGEMKRVFSDLFRRNPTARIFHFLNEDQTVGEDARLMSTLPVGMFLKAMFKAIVFRNL